MAVCRDIMAICANSLTGSPPRPRNARHVETNQLAVMGNTSTGWNT